MAEPTVEQQLSHALKLTQEVRSCVSYVFKKLNDGKIGSKEQSEDSDNFLDEFGKGLLNVNKTLGELEKVASNIAPAGGPVPLGNSRLLTLDPSLDKTTLYAELVHSYKWANKLHEQSGQVALLLQQNQLRRSHISSGLASKRQRRMPLTGHNVPTTTVDNFVSRLDQLFPDMTITVTRPFGSPAVLLVNLGHTMKAVIMLRGLTIEYVSVRGMTEVLELGDGKMDVWTPSKYEVFKKVTDHANSAVLQHQFAQVSHLILKNFLSWLNSYINLFSAPCHRCGHILQNNLPPTWRDLRHYLPYHEACKP